MSPLLDEKQKEEFLLGLKIKGIKKVKEDLAQQIYGPPNDATCPRAALAKHWVEQIEVEEQETQRKKELALIAEGNQIAQEANRISMEANIKAKHANALSVFAILISLLTAVGSIIAEIFFKK